MTSLSSPSFVEKAVSRFLRLSAGGRLLVKPTFAGGSAIPGEIGDLA
ncbi:hypothetical protein ACU045_12495 [Microbacterium sp. MAHUQ-60]